MEIIPLIILVVVAIIFVRLVSRTDWSRRKDSKRDIFTRAWKRIDGQMPDKRSGVKRLKIDWRLIFQSPRERRRDYYRNVYLKSDEWKKKRYVVLKRDNWRCVHCGAPATQVHHKKYLRKKIGKEPIRWLESVCKSCHESIHGHTKFGSKKY